MTILSTAFMHIRSIIGTSFSFQSHTSIYITIFNKNLCPTSICGPRALACTQLITEHIKVRCNCKIVHQTGFIKGFCYLYIIFYHLIDKKKSVYNTSLNEKNLFCFFFFFKSNQLSNRIYTKHGS